MSAASNFASDGAWPLVPPERLSPQLVLLYTSAFQRFDHRNTLPGAGLYLVVEGQVTYVNGGCGAISAKAGDLVCLRPGPVETHAPRGFRVYAAVYRAAQNIPNGVPGLPGLGLLPTLLSLRGKRQVDEARQLYERMLASLLARRATFSIEVFAALSELLRFAFMLADQKQTREPPEWTSWERLLALIEDRNEDLTNTQLARAMNLGVRAFGQGFKRRFGITPKQYLLRRRLWRAREALRAGKSVKAAAFDFHFATPSHFSRLYKQVFGVAPSNAAASSAPELNPETVFPAGPLYFFTPGFGSADFRPKT